MRHVSRHTEELGSARSGGPDRGVSVAPSSNNQMDVDQGFQVVDDRRLPKQARLNGKRRLVARFATLAFDRVEERRFLAADVGPGPLAQLDVEGEARIHDVRAE